MSVGISSLTLMLPPVSLIFCLKKLDKRRKVLAEEFEPNTNLITRRLEPIDSLTVDHERRLKLIISDVLAHCLEENLNSYPSA